MVFRRKSEILNWIRDNSGAAEYSSVGLYYVLFSPF